MTTSVEKVYDALPNLKARVHSLTLQELEIGVSKAGPDVYQQETGEPALNKPAQPFLVSAVTRANPTNIQIMFTGAQNAIIGRATLTTVLDNVGDNTLIVNSPLPLDYEITNA